MREKIINLIAEGFSTEEIARITYYSAPNVKKLIKKYCKEYNATNRPNLIYKYYKKSTY